MEKPTVSIIISIYNAEKYLTECIESILAQTLKNAEVICVDDASTDATPQILLEYQDKITILTNRKNCMAGESRNRGFQAATGEYVIFLDADDVFESDMLKKAYNKAKSCNADICIFRENLFSESVERCSGYPYVETLMEQLGRREFFSPLDVSDLLFNLWNGWAWDKLFRREFIVNSGLKFSNLQTSEDGFFVHAAMASASRISFLNEVLVHHRIGNGNSLSNTRDIAWESCLIYLKELKQYLIQRYLFSAFERSYINWVADFLYWNYQTLNDRSRQHLLHAMRVFFTRDLAIEQYAEEYFYNAFSWWFISCIVNEEEKEIPLTEEEHFEKIYQCNVVKLKNLHEYILNRQWTSAVWGAGIRGQAFVKVCGKNWGSLRAVYDSDKTKQGRELVPGLMIKGIDEKQAEKTDIILVLNSAHLLSIQKLLNGKRTVLFDMNTYLNFSYRIEECLMRCSE